MTIFSFTHSSSSDLSALKQQYLQHLNSPLDGMWETFAAMADHYAISYNDQIIGYGIINADRKLLQFFVADASKSEAAFDQLLLRQGVTGAYTTTNQVAYLSLCMDYQNSISVNALTYRVENLDSIQAHPFPLNAHFKMARHADLPAIVKFGCQTLGTDTKWLTKYFSDRIDGKELFGLWSEDLLVATGECRPNYAQTPYADLGMLVSPSHRRQGIATGILRHLLVHSKKMGLRPICSTERSNIGARKAIISAGFTCHHRILDIMF